MSDVYIETTESYSSINSTNTSSIFGSVLPIMSEFSTDKSLSENYLLKDEKDFKYVTPHTKVMCTIGPSCSSPETLRELLSNGMSLARFNLSHGAPDVHREAVRRLRSVCTELGRFCAVVVDTRGSALRMAGTGGAKVPLKKGAKLRLRHGDLGADFSSAVEVFVNDAEALALLKADDVVRIGFGEIKLRVLGLDSGEAECEVLNEGVLRSRKTVFLPRGRRRLPRELTPADREDVAFAAEVAADFVATSYVTCGGQVRAIRALMREQGLKDAKVIAKIDCEEALLNFDEVLTEADAVCVSRGNLGEEIDLEAVILAQKLIMRKCNARGKPVVTATQLLESMRINPSPTRAEASDVGNAVFDGADCVVLAGETADGLYPLKSTQMAALLLREAERSVDHLGTFELVHGRSLGLRGALPLREALAASAVKMSFDVDAAVLVVFSSSGTTALLIAKYRPKCPVLLVTADGGVARHALISRGVLPVLSQSAENPEEALLARVLDLGRGLCGYKSGGLAVVVRTNEATDECVEGQNSVNVVCIL